MLAPSERRILVSVQDYLNTVDVGQLLTSLIPGSVDFLQRQVEHFTLNEGEHRDEIVLSYFGKEGLDRLVNAVADMVTNWSFSGAPTVLDVGSGVGTFTIPIMSRAKKAFLRARFYAMDVTPALLRILAKKTGDVLPFIGVAENLLESARQAGRHLEIPESFDVIVSTLALHHCPDISRVFESMHRVLAEHGKAIIADLCKHPFSEFKEEMGDYHLGFELEALRTTAGKYFGNVEVRVAPGPSCSSSGRSAQMFLLTMEK